MRDIVSICAASPTSDIGKTLPEPPPIQAEWPRLCPYPHPAAITALHPLLLLKAASRAGIRGAQRHAVPVPVHQR